MKIFTSRKINTFVAKSIAGLIAMTVTLMLSSLFINSHNLPIVYALMQFCFKYGQYVVLILIILILIYLATSGLIIGRYTAKLTRSKAFKDFGILDPDFVKYLQSNTNEFKWLIEQYPKDVDFSAKYIVLKIKLMQGNKKDIY